MSPEQRVIALADLSKAFRATLPADGRERLIVKTLSTRIKKKPVSSRAADDTETVVDSDEMIIEGYGALFDVDTDIGWFIESVAPGAFTNSIAKDDVRGLYNHDRNIVLGRTGNGTMKLWEDEKGLWYEITINPKSQMAKDVHATVERKDVNEASFSFNTLHDDWIYSEDGDDIRRRLIEVKLFDTGPVTFGQYVDATSSARSMEKVIDEINKIKPEPSSRMKANWRMLEHAEHNTDY